MIGFVNSALHAEVSILPCAVTTRITGV